MITLGTWVAMGVFATMSLGALAVTTWWRATTPEEAPRSALRPLHERATMVHGLGRLAAPDEPELEQRLRDRLAQAGYASPRALELWLAVRVVLGLGLGGTVAALVAPSSLALRALAALSATAFGYYLPWAVVRLQRTARRRRIQAGVPNMLDMLVSCLEAGLGTDAALQHVAGEVGMASEELAAELQLTHAEIRAGVPRTEALEDLDRRTGVESLSSLVSVLGQAERYGAGVAQSLRAHARLARRRRTLHAEQRAAKASPVMTVVMILFILPPLFVVLLGPMIVNLVERFLPAVG